MRCQLSTGWPPTVEAMYRPFYDMATRIIQGSDGKVVWLPIFVDGEAGRTTIYKLEIDVHTFTN